MTRGELWWADLGIPSGSESGFRRPVLIIQDDSFNRSKINTTIVLPLTTNLVLAEAPGNIYLKKESSNLSKDSVIVVSQITVIDKIRLTEKIAKLPRELIKDIECGLKTILGIIL